MKLRTVRPSLRAAAPLLGRGSAAAAAPTAAPSRQRSDHWRGWYSTARWKRLRESVLIRDGYRCRHTGILLIGDAPAPDSPVVHHILSHRGDPALFWDPANLEAVAKAWHDAQAQAAEHREAVGPL